MSNLRKAWKQLFYQYYYWSNLVKLNDEFLATFNYGTLKCEVEAPRNLFKQRLQSTAQDIVLVGRALGARHLDVALRLMTRTRYPSKNGEIMHMLTSKGNPLSSYDSNDWVDLRDSLFGKDYKDQLYRHFYDREPASVCHTRLMSEYRKLLVEQIVTGLNNLGVPDSLFEQDVKEMTHCSYMQFNVFSNYEIGVAAFLLKHHRHYGSKSKRIENYLTNSV